MSRTRLTARAGRVGLWGALLALLTTMVLAAGASAAPTRAALAKKAAPTGTPPTAGKTGKPKPANGLPPGAAAPTPAAKGTPPARGSAAARHPVVEPSAHPRVGKPADDGRPLLKPNPNIRLPRTGPAAAAPPVPGRA